MLFSLFSCCSSILRIWGQNALPSLFLGKQPNQKQTKKQNHKTLWLWENTKTAHMVNFPPLFLAKVSSYSFWEWESTFTVTIYCASSGKPGEITHRIPQGNVSPALQILTLPWEPVPGISLRVTKEGTDAVHPSRSRTFPMSPPAPQYICVPGLEPERAREEPPGRFMIMIPSVWGVWGLGSGGSRSLSCCLSCAVLVFSREVEPSEYRLSGGLSG